MSWDHLSADQRKSVAWQWDYQHNPAAEPSKEFWWDFYQSKIALNEKIAKWKSVPIKDASDLAKQEARLAELEQELARMEQQELLVRANYHPPTKQARDAPDGNSPTPFHLVRFIAYPKAIKQLTERLGSTPFDLAAWVWLGPKAGGLVSFVSVNEIDPPRIFHFAAGGIDFDYLSPMMACWFREDDIANFTPTESYITGSALIERWGQRSEIQPEAFVQAKITESRLQEIHPIYGATQGTFPGNTIYPPLASGLFALSQVKKIEVEDFGEDERTTVKCRAISPLAIEQVKQLEVDTSGRVFDVFRAMANLNAGELTFSFVGEKSESGLGANNMVEISARQETRRVALAAFDLVDRRRGSLNGQGAILLGMAGKKKLTYTGANAAKMKRLRDVFRAHLSIVGDPFEPYRKGSGWVPRFTVADKRGMADERAKREAESRTDSLEQINERGDRFASNGLTEHPFDADNDDADKWLKNHDLNESS